MSTYAPNFVTVSDQADHLGNSVDLVDAAIWGRGFRPQPFVAAGISSPQVWGEFGLPDGYVAQSYLTQWFIENVDEPIDYTLQSGSLPTGLSLSNVGATAEGEISGTPTTAGSYTFTLRATGPTATADKEFTIVIHAATDTGSSFVGGL